MKSTLEIPPLYRYWLRPGGTKEITKLSSSSRARASLSYIICDLILPDPAPSASCCCHVSHVRSSVSSRLTLSRVPLCPVESWFPIRSSLYHDPLQLSLPNYTPLQVPAYLITTRQLVVVGWCLLAHPRNPLVLQPVCDFSPFSATIAADRTF